MSVKISSTVKLKPAANIIYEELLPNIKNILFTNNSDPIDSENIKTLIRKHSLTRYEENIIMDYSYIRYQNSLYQQLMKNNRKLLESELKSLNKLSILGKIPSVQRNFKHNYVLDRFIDEYYPENNNSEANKKNTINKIQRLKEAYERSIARNNKAALRRDSMKTQSILGNLSSKQNTYTKDSVLPPNIIKNISEYSVTTRKAGKRRKKRRNKKTQKGRWKSKIPLIVI